MASAKQKSWRKKFAAMAKARFKKNKSSSHNKQKDTAVKGRSTKKRRHSSGGRTKTRSRTSGRTKGYSRPRRKSSGGSGFDVTKILTQVAVSVAMVFGVTYLVNMILNKFNLQPDKANIAKWALTLGIPGLALFFGKKYPLVQAAAVATIAYAVFNWAKNVLPVGAQTALAGFPQAPYNPLIPVAGAGTAQSSGTLTPLPLS